MHVGCVTMSAICFFERRDHHEVTDLKPDTAYMFNVRAVNEAGVGEPCECEVATAPVEIATVVVSEICSAPNEDIGSL